MLTSACCPRSNPPRPGGFTLIEMLTVLVIAGLLAALTAPSVLRTIRTMERQSQYQVLRGQIVELPYRAWVEGKSHTLGGNGPGEFRLQLAEAWRLEVPRPIRYAFNGLCSGGTVILHGPDGWREAFRLEGPRCDRLLPVPG
jgi:prepilin-type N-terminal cleavage/methylation domain-containing protein